MRSDRAPAARRYWAVVVFLILGTVAGVWHNRCVNTGRPDYIAASLRAVISVPARAFRGVAGWIGNQTEWIRRGRSLAAENRMLRDRVATLEGENNQLKEAQIDLDRLRADLGFAGTAKHRYIAADIIAMKPDPKFDTMVIGRSGGDGVKSSSVVVNRDGVVGRVFEVDPGSAAVLMLTDQKSGVGARIQRSRAIGICEGDNSPTLSMLGLPNTADVRVGDAVVTSGLGGVYPGGLLLGSVSEVLRDAANGGMVVRVKPQVAFDRLEEVYIIPMKIAPNVRRTVLVILLLICASAAQGVWANAMRISGARPDFVLITAILCSQFCSAIEGAVIGLGAGLLSGSLASPFDGGYGSIVVSRTLVCFGVGWLEERVFRDNAAIAIALVSGGTLLAEGAFYVFDPHFPAVRWARSVGLELIYNVCLALPIYLAVRISMRPRKLATTGQIS